MSDLIRREDVIKLVNQFVFCLCKEQNDEVRKTFIKYIEKMPTAYYIDKVIEELEGLRKVDMCESGDCSYEDTLCCDCTQYRMLDKAIEIVNQFGVGKKVEE